MHGDGSFDFGWWTHNALFMWFIIDSYTWNSHNFIDQCHPNKFNFKKVKLEYFKKFKNDQDCIAVGDRGEEWKKIQEPNEDSGKSDN